MWNCNGSASPALPGAPGPLHCDPLAAADEKDLMATLASHQMDAPRGRHAQSGPRSALGPNVGPPVKVPAILSGGAGAVRIR